MQIAVWDAVVGGWKFSQVVTKRIWDQGPWVYQSPSSGKSKGLGGNRRFTSAQRKVARHSWYQTLIGRHGYKAGRWALRPRKK